MSFLSALKNLRSFINSPFVKAFFEFFLKMIGPVFMGALVVAIIMYVSSQILVYLIPL